MGMFGFLSSHSASRGSQSPSLIGKQSCGCGPGAPFFDAKDAPPNHPRPDRFEIIRTETYGKYLVAEIRWPDSPHYEGRKVLVFKATEAELRAAKFIDPHFHETRGPLIPIARFEPTPFGWVMACGCARMVMT